MKPSLKLVPIIAASLFLVSCSEMGGEEAQATAKIEGELEQRQPTKVRVAAVIRKEMVRTLITSREVESENQIDIFPRAQGVLIELSVEEGDTVEAGQVLATLDQREAKASVEDARIGMEEASDTVEKAEVSKREAEAVLGARLLARNQAARDFERNEKAKLISGQDLDKLAVARDTALAEHEQAKLALDRASIEARTAGTAITRATLALERAELTLSYTQIVAPIPGVISKRSIRVGDSVSSAGVAFTLTDHESLIVVFPRPQRELPLFSRSAEAVAALELNARAEALPNTVFRGEILRISPAIDPENGSFRVTARLDQPTLESGDARLLPGMLVRLEIITDRHPGALVVPKRALRREGDIDLLFVAEKGRARRVEVEEGFSNDDEVEVHAKPGFELTEVDYVVIVGNRDLEDGSEVDAEFMTNDEEEAAPQESEAEAVDDSTAPSATDENE